MILSGLSNILNSMYTDVMSITRYVESINADGTSDSSLSPSPIYSDIPCRVSFSSMDSSNSPKEDTNPKNLYIKIFCGSDVDIQKGDTITVNRLNENEVVMATYSGTASLPLQYTTHKEFSLSQDGDA